MVYKLFDSLLDLPSEDLVPPDLSELSHPFLPTVSTVRALETQAGIRTHVLLAAEAGGLSLEMSFSACLAVSPELSLRPQHALSFLPRALWVSIAILEWIKERQEKSL